MATWSRLGFGMGVAVLAMTTLCPITSADEAEAAGQGATIGVTVGVLSEAQRDRLGYSADGVLVTAVDKSGAAAQAGIAPGDILVVVGSTTVRSIQDLAKAENKLAVGEEVSVVVARNGGRFIKVLTVVPTAAKPPMAEAHDTDIDESAKPPVPFEKPPVAAPTTEVETPLPTTAVAPRDVVGTPVTAAPEAVATPPAAASETLSSLGLECQDLDSDLAAALGATGTSGAVVLRVRPDSPAATAGLRAGDVVLKLGDQDVGGVAVLEQTVERLGREPAWHVQRQGQEREVSLAPPPPPPAPEPAAPEVQTPEASTPSDEERSATIAELRNEVESLRTEVLRLRRQIARMRDRDAER